MKNMALALLAIVTFSPAYSISLVPTEAQTNPVKGTNLILQTYASNRLNVPAALENNIRLAAYYGVGSNVGRGSNFGRGSNVGPGSNFGRGSNVGPGSNFGRGSNVGPGSNYGRGSNVGPGSNFGRGSNVGPGSNFGRGSNVGPGSNYCRSNLEMSYSGQFRNVRFMQSRRFPFVSNPLYKYPRGLGTESPF